MCLKHLLRVRERLLFLRRLWRHDCLSERMEKGRTERKREAPNERKEEGSLVLSSNFCATMTRRFFVGVRRRLRRVKRTHKMEKNLSLWWLLLGKSAFVERCNRYIEEEETNSLVLVLFIVSLCGVFYTF